MKPSISTHIFLFACIIHLGACSDNADVSAQAKQAIQPPQVAASSTTAQVNEPVSHPALPSASNGRSGTVKSARVGGGYSFIETDINGNTVWIATMATTVQPGQQIAWNDHAVMHNFTSKALNQTFDQILFVDRIRPASNINAHKQHGGVVLEMMSAAGYSYLKVDEKGRELWVAAPMTTVRVGQQISWSGGSPMRNFSSRALDRTFDEILFVNAIQVVSG